MLVREGSGLKLAGEEPHEQSTVRVFLTPFKSGLFGALRYRLVVGLESEAAGQTIVRSLLMHDLTDQAHARECAARLSAFVGGRDPA